MSNKLSLIKVRRANGRAGRTLYAINQDGSPVFHYPSENYNDPLTFNAASAKKAVGMLEDLGYNVFAKHAPAFAMINTPSKSQMKALQKRARN